MAEQTVVVKSGDTRWARWIGAAILFVVAYVHLALFLNMPTLRLLPMLFLLNAVGALVAMAGLLMNSRWAGWLLGAVMSGGAALAWLVINFVPGAGALVMGGRAGRVRPNGGGAGARSGRAPQMGAPQGGAPQGGTPQGGNWSGTPRMGGNRAPGAAQFGNRGPGGMHGILPLFANQRTVAWIALVIEIAFVLLAVWGLMASKKAAAGSEA